MMPDLRKRNDRATRIDRVSKPGCVSRYVHEWKHKERSFY
jgi:hypothetical protein